MQRRTFLVTLQEDPTYETSDDAVAQEIHDILAEEQLPVLEVKAWKTHATSSEEAERILEAYRF